MKILLVPNYSRKDSVACTNNAVRLICAFGATPAIESKNAEAIQSPADCEVDDNWDGLLASCDAVLSIGGDGTLLRTVRHAVRHDKPVLGVNTGRVGFLTQLEGSELHYLAQVVEGKYSVVERMMLEVKIFDEGRGERIHHVLNDITFFAPGHHLADFDIRSHGKLLMQHRADGVIFSTPTGTTAYSLAAGGAVVDPTLELVSLTAINPHTPYNRSLIIPPDLEYTVSMEQGWTDDGLDVHADGHRVDTVPQGCPVIVRRSGLKAKFIDLGLRDFYSSFREKIIWRR